MTKTTPTKKALPPITSQEKGQKRNHDKVETSNRKVVVINALASGIHILAILSGLASSICLLDLLADARRGGRPHHFIKVTAL
jgi:NADPH-dependent glutamate synthase beta subunit-like oxidoreductase